ncbi:unnamed protein product [Urochloa humidicola]
MSGALAGVRMVAARRSSAPLRRYVRRRLKAPSTIAKEIASLSEEERALMSNHLIELDAELQSRLVQQVDAFFQRSTISNDQGILNRVLTFCRVPKGARRDRLVWRSCLAATFLGSAVMGQWEACKCAQYHDECQRKHEEEAAAPSAVNHAA